MAFLHVFVQCFDDDSFFGAYGHSVFDILVQLTEGRSV